MKGGLSAIHKLEILVLAAALAGPLAAAQDNAQDSPALPEGPLAAVTVLTGGGATRGADGPAFRDSAGRFSDRASAVKPGDSVVTAADGSAAIFFPRTGMTVQLQPASELKVAESPGTMEQLPFSLILSKGRALVVRKASDQALLVIAGQVVPGQGYTLSKGASLVVAADTAGVRFTVDRGTALYFAGPVPGQVLDAAGEPADKGGVTLSAGQSISSGQPAPVADADTGPAAVRDFGNDIFGFAHDMGGEWVADAERGDFTPVRGESRASAEALVRQAGLAQPAFDQARATITTPTPQTSRFSTLPIQVVSNPVAALVQSGVPSEVVVGQRFRRTRIIGNPGTSGGQQIRINPFAEQLIRLPGGSRSRTPQVPTNNSH